MADETPNDVKPAVQLDYRPPSAEPRRVGPSTAFWWVLGASVLAVFIFFALMPNRSPSMRLAMRAKCSSNLKNIAAAMIAYANMHQGTYPASMEELISSSGMTSAVLVCPESNDTQATTPAELADLSVGGHCSYIYLGKGLNDQATSDIVLAYEPLANHKNTGMNVLFGDYHTQWLTAAEGKQLIASIVPGKPTVWPVPAAAQPSHN